MTITTPPPTTTSRATLPLFVAAEALSLFGNAAITVVLPWLVLTRTGDPSVAALVAAVAAAPSILATLVGGWLIDHVGQRRMSVVADLGSAISVAALAIVDRIFGLDLGWFIALGVLGALFDVPGMTARETLVGRVSVTSGVILDRVVAIRQGVFGVAFLAGPAVAGVLLSVLDPIDVVWLTAACSALAALCTLVMPLVAGAPDETAADGQPQPGGFATLWASPALRAMVVIAFGSALLTAPLITVLLPAHFSRLGQADWLGYTLSAFAAGSIVGSVLYGVLAARSRRLVYVLGLLLQVAGMAGFATLQGFWLVAAGSVLVGVGGGLLSPIFLVFFTEQVAERVRGRVLSLVNALGMVAIPIGLSLMALLLTRAPLGVGALVVFLGFAGVSAYALVSRGCASSLRRDRLTGVLTISQLAAYAQVSVRTVRWYHQRGLLPEPGRDASGYRRYDGQAVIDLVRIRTLAGAGVPLARVAELLRADAEEFRAAVQEVDAELGRTIAELEQRRMDLAQLPSAERLCISEEVLELLELERSIGISERTIAMERDAWILLAAAYPEMQDEALHWKQRTLGNPGYQQLMVRMDQAYDWTADDPRLVELARDCVDVMAEVYPPQAAAEYVENWTVDAARYQLVADHGQGGSPAWSRLNALVEKLSRERGYPTW